MTTSRSATQLARDLRVVFGRLRRRLREMALPGDLSPSQVAVLVRLDKEGPATASRLAAAEGIRSQSMGATVASLEAAGLVTREADPTDGRSRVVVLTAAGVASARGAREAREEQLARELDARYTQEERETILSALRLLERLTG